jgi:hypothetical protein
MRFGSRSQNDWRRRGIFNDNFGASPRADQKTWRVSGGFVG